MSLDTILAAVEQRLDTDEAELAMRPYKPKTAAEKRIKNDPAHRLMRQAYTRRTSADVTRQKKVRDQWYNRNRAQILQRQRMSRKRTGLTKGK